MIPPHIHYCWFGGAKKPRLAEKCIASWKKHCPGYEITEWNESNFDISAYPYAEYCLKNRKWAFLSDFVRLDVVNRYGGIYFDTDVEAVRSFDPLLEYGAFYGFENDDNIATGLGFGAEPGHITVAAMEEQYLSLLPDENGVFPTVTCPVLNTKALVPLGLEKNGQLQTVAGAVILPTEYLNPYDDPTGRLLRTDNTYSIHWYSKSWMSRATVFRSMLTKPFHRVFGKDCFRHFRLPLEGKVSSSTASGTTTDEVSADLNHSADAESENRNERNK